MNIDKLTKRYKKYLNFNQNLSSYTWFGVGGIADIVFTPENMDQAIQFIKEKPKDLSIFTIGAGSNILIRDKGIRGASVITKKLNGISIDGEGIITAETGTIDMQLARFARENERSGLEFLVGIPGTVGGGIRMNSGAFGSEFKDILIDVKAIKFSGEEKVFTLKELQMNYRNISLDDDWFFCEARFRTSKGVKGNIQSKMKNIIELRKKAQPTGVKTGGSTFMNTPNYKAWELIEKAGCRGLQVGDAMVSPKHCNFIINKKNSSAEQIEQLGDLIKEKVMISSGIKLNWEIKRVGLK